MKLQRSRWHTRCWVGAAVALLGCGPALTDDTDTDGDEGSDTEPRDTDLDPGTGSETTDSTSTTTSTTGEPPGPEEIAISVNRDVDILFVIDDSGSMGAKQARLTPALQSFIEVLETPDVNANYRIAFTTTDNGNLWCVGSGASVPEGGRLELSSCRSRLDEFFFSGTDFDASYVCTDACDIDQIPVLPTTTAFDPQPRERPWLERADGQTNLADGTAMADAVACAAPLGISGCGFESPLESMLKALRRADEEAEDQFGFVRDGAVLSIVFLTDEADCSFNATVEESVFSNEGPQTFWSLPGEQIAPSSAVCWNAGVSCSPSGAPSYDGCEPIDLDPLGVEVSGATAQEEASLLPVSRYTEALDELENLKQQLNPGQEILVSAIVGVPTAYPAEPIPYALGPDAQNINSFQARFGIGPGCQVDEADGTVTEAVPPVRLREFAAFFQVGETPNLHSVCDGNYAPALAATAEAVRSQLRPACMPACVADTDPTTAVVDPVCTVTQTSRDAQGQLVETNILPCTLDGTLPAGATACFHPLVDPDGTVTPSPDDDMSSVCAEEGWNLEYRIVRAAGAPAPSGASLRALCQLSQNRPVDCPLLP